MATKLSADLRSAKNGKPKRAPRGKPFAKGNIWRFPPGESPNPGGRPKVLVQAYLEVLGYVDVDDMERTQALAIAETMCQRALAGDVAAAREIRLATEGQRLSVDLTVLSDAQLDALAAGVPPAVVLLASADAGADDAQP
jgi:hypothetical protein